ncbi:restriction endonuclease subunit S [Anaerovibrio lipolyticus]|uniref:restriction endonuclease subunit S n=1 Tax=Anaerovibrio lipolyticus TaxID=82374 RepID=UPI0025F64169|nr:restriction endonuclease subunit S [Anaerovibrio lipolyticus]
MSKKQLTTEEKMNNALVPEEEWPYELPDNWCWVRLGDIAADMADGPFGSNLKTEHYTSNKEVRIIQLSNVSEDGWRDENVRYTTFEHVKKIARSIVEPGNIIITKMMPAGRAMICPSNEKKYVLSSDNVKFVPYACLNSKYVVRALNSQVFRKQVQENTQGITRARTSIKKLKSYYFPLAPSPEQQRIVSRIESLFAKLDEAKEKIQNVLDGAENRKTAILHQAFTGKLTAKWRKENSVTDDSWEKKTLQEVCCTKITDGTHKTPKYSTKEDGGIPFISAKDVTKGMICWDNIKYIVPELHEELYKRLAPQRDDVLLAKNGTTGVAAIVETDMIFDLYVTLAVLRPNKEKVYPRFLLNIVNSPICKRQFDEHLTGIGVPNLHLRDIKEIEIGLPKLPEQQEIVRLLDQFLDKEKSICESCEASLVTIETMKKAILAKAFRGELGTNNPAEESAKELLTKCLTTVV